MLPCDVVMFYLPQGPEKTEMEGLMLTVDAYHNLVFDMGSRNNRVSTIDTLHNSFLRRAKVCWGRCNTGRHRVQDSSGQGFACSVTRFLLEVALVGGALLIRSCGNREHRYL